MFLCMITCKLFPFVTPAAFQTDELFRVPVHELWTHVARPQMFNKRLQIGKRGRADLSRNKRTHTHAHTTIVKHTM